MFIWGQGNMILFTPTVDFFEERLGSGYVAGLVYTIRPHYHLLNELVHNEWLPEGKVRIIASREEAMPGKSKLSGAGEVKPAPARKPSTFERIRSWLSRI